MHHALDVQMLLAIEGLGVGFRLLSLAVSGLGMQGLRGWRHILGGFEGFGDSGATVPGFTDLRSCAGSCFGLQKQVELLSSPKPKAPIPRNTQPLPSLSHLRNCSCPGMENARRDE